MSSLPSTDTDDAVFVWASASELSATTSSKAVPRSVMSCAAKRGERASNRTREKIPRFFMKGLQGV